MREAGIELQGGRHARALRRAGQEVRGVVVHGPRPGRRRPRDPPAARRRRRDRALELPHDAAVQQARPGAAVRQHGGGQAGRHDAADHAADRRDPAEAGLPPGVLNVVPGSGAVAGEALVTHPLVRKVAFTGSTPAGRADVAALAAKGAKRVTLELGGSDPMIICDDADLARRRARRAWGASTTAARRAWRSSACTCSRRSPTR